MGEQATFFKTLGGEEVAVPVRGKHYVQPRGYARRPGSGPEGETCKTCRHKVYRHWGKAYPKCGLTEAAWTNSRRTDILVNSPACEKWEPIP